MSDDDFQPVAQPAPDDDFKPVASTSFGGADVPPVWQGPTADAIASQGTMGRMMSAFKQSASEEWGASSWSPDIQKTLGEWKPDGDMAKSFNDHFVKPAVNALDNFIALQNAPIRATKAVIAGAASAAVEGGVPPDLIGMTLENPMFAGGPGVLGKVMIRPGLPKITGGTGDIVNLPVAKDLGVIGDERPSISEGTPAEAAAKAITPITAYHGSPYSFDAFSNDKIGTGEGAASYGHGIYFAEHPAVAEDYAARLSVDRSRGYDYTSITDAIVKQNSGNWEKAATAYETTLNEKAALAEKVGGSYTPTKAEQEILADLKKGPLGNKYQVRIHANVDDMLYWDRPANQQPAGLEEVYKANNMDLSGTTTGEDAYKQLATKLGSKQAASAALRDAGIPGVRYLDQNSRPQNKIGSPIPPDILGALSNLGYLGFDRPSQALSVFRDIQSGKENRANWDLDQPQDAAAVKLVEDYAARPLVETPEEQTHNFVVFNDKDVEITHRNGEPVPQAMPASTALEETKTKLPTATGPDDGFEARFNSWVDKLETHDDVKNLIRESAQQNGMFPAARRGDIPVTHQAAMSEATGIPIDQLDFQGMGRLMKSDEEFRVAAQLMLKTNDDVFEAARDHRAQNTPESRAALVQSMIKRDLALEQVVGRRAEWGRTGNVMQEFLEASKTGQGLSKFLKDRKGEGWDANKLDEVANELAGLNSREQVGRFLTETRKPDFVDKALWYWTNAILSGPITHLRYVLANSAMIAHDTFLATPLAGISGAVRQAMSDEKIDRVYMGETMAKAYGIIAGLPDAVRAAGTAAKTGVPTPLPPQLLGAQRTNPVTGLKPIGGKLGTAIGLPSNAISGIHSFFNFLGYRSEIEAQAYRRAVKDGYHPASIDFWNAQKMHAQHPDDPMMDAGIAAGAKMNFVQDLGPSGQAAQAFLFRTKFGRFVVPFLKVPGNIFNAVQEGTPFAWMDARMRADLKDKGPTGDMARGRFATGAAVMGTAAYWTTNGQITGNGPIDPKQRAEWLLTNQPRSVKIGDKWVSYDRFGPIGGWLGLAADITDASAAVYHSVQANKMTPNEQKSAQEALAEGGYRVVAGFTKWFEDAGFEGLFDLVNAMSDPEHSRVSSVGATAASLLPGSSMLAQGASFLDPYVRSTQTFLDGVKSRIPVWREGLKPVRDWTGSPMANPQYHSLFRERSATPDPVDQEMQRLDLKPTKVENQIKGVPLDPDQYDEYQTLAGINTKLRLNSLINGKGWQTIPQAARARIMEKEIGSARVQAATTMQARYPNLIQEGIDNRMQGYFIPKPSTAYQRPQ